MPPQNIKDFFYSLVSRTEEGFLMNRRCSAHIAAQRFTHETGLRVLAAVCLTLGLGCAERTPAAPTWTLTETLRLG